MTRYVVRAVPLAIAGVALQPILLAALLCAIASAALLAEVIRPGSRGR